MKCKFTLPLLLLFATSAFSKVPTIKLDHPLFQYMNEYSEKIYLADGSLEKCNKAALKQNKKLQSLLAKQPNKKKFLIWQLENGLTSLMLAVLNGDTHLVKTILSQPEVNELLAVQYSGLTALDFAYLGSPEFCKFATNNPHAINLASSGYMSLLQLGVTFPYFSSGVYEESITLLKQANAPSAEKVHWQLAVEYLESVKVELTEQFKDADLDPSLQEHFKNAIEVIDASQTVLNNEKPEYFKDTNYGRNIKSIVDNFDEDEMDDSDEDFEE